MDKNKILEKDQRRYEVLRWIFDEAGGNESSFVDLRNFRGEEKFKLSDLNQSKMNNELETISDYLAGKNLIKQIAENGLFVQLTHQGIIEIEESIKNPEKPTDNFPAPGIQNFNTFNAPVGSVQQGNENIANVQQNFDSKTEDIIKLLQGLQEHISDDNKQEGLEYIEGLETEVKSEKPSESRMRLFLNGLAGVMKDTGKELLIEVGKKVIAGEIQLPNL